ncbi:FKBP-type peptidyl-prolyl cis-trans isomerase [Volucribacter amazonae]|uniref:Peptidyl-prolyl cis-trans isomerase n=1 Tax=Volucribacter amazonae TaxID=256731 RepID=A0A9X4P9X4_9PAST|nr:FKBP-type peptidyl-prolyl cis-trans isomerase [Volucribacter amazonae]MDG6895203.1 peptidylprolyl isomerase [Volucribacter amazonae]
MKKLSSVALLVTTLFSANLMAQQITDKTFIDDSSYALGVAMGKQLEDMVDSQKDVIQFDTSRILAGVEDSLQGKVSLSDQEVGERLQALTNRLAEIEQAKLEKAAIEAKQQGDEYRANYAKQKDVKQTASGLLYKIEKQGEGISAKPEDTVKVHYVGKLIDGTEFDSSVKRGQPVEFKLDQLIPGWVEGIQLIKKGGKIELVLPPELAYGDQATGNIPANSTLIFDIELLDVIPAKK